jgi:hypothetical protein
MRIVYLEGVLMDNREFICSGKSMILTEEQIKKYVRETSELKVKGHE